MNMHQGNIFSNRNNSIKSRSKSVSNIFINDSLKSIDNEKLFFINYMKSNLCKEYILLHNYITLLKNNDFSFLEKDFISTDYTTDVESKNEKIKELIKNTSNIIMDNNDLINLIKYKHKKYKEFQIFIIYDKNSNSGFVRLIDLYHMVIPTSQVLKNGEILLPNEKRHYTGIKNRVGHKVDLYDLKQYLS